jgi:hypothetical protein
MKRRKKSKVTAWLITRHWVSDHERHSDEVVAIFSPRLGGVRVREFVELIDVTSGFFTLSEQLSMMWPRHGRVPYPARFGQNADGDPWECEIHCGGDPYLLARLVDDLAVERDADGKERAVWTERPRARSVPKPHLQRTSMPKN